MKRLLITLLLVSPFSFADTGKTISLECKLTELGKNTYMLSEQYKNEYREFLARMKESQRKIKISKLGDDWGASAAQSFALRTMRMEYEFTLKGIEVDKDVDKVVEIMPTKLAGYTYEWEPSELRYNKYVLSIWTLVTINRENLSYSISQYDMSIASPARDKGTYRGKCKIIQLEREF